jgi:hypothetical protein
MRQVDFIVKTTMSILKDRYKQDVPVMNILTSQDKTQIYKVYAKAILDNKVEVSSNAKEKMSNDFGKARSFATSMALSFFKSNSKLNGGSKGKSKNSNDEKGLKELLKLRDYVLRVHPDKKDSIAKIEAAIEQKAKSFNMATGE